MLQSFFIKVLSNQIYNLTKKDGLMFHIIPFEGNINHGFFNYHPVFFYNLAMFNNYESRFETFYTSTHIPILMISGSQDELFDTEHIESTYNLINNKNKALISLEGETHTSIIWSAGNHINTWLEDYAKTQ